MTPNNSGGAMGSISGNFAGLASPSRWLLKARLFREQDDKNKFNEKKVIRAGGLVSGNAVHLNCELPTRGANPTQYHLFSADEPSHQYRRDGKLCCSPN